MIFRMHSWTPASAGATGGANVNTSIETALTSETGGFVQHCGLP